MLNNEQKELLEKLIKQEEKYIFDNVTQDDVLLLGECVKEESLKLEKPVAVEAALGAFTVYRYFPTGRGLIEEGWIAGKRNTVMAYGICSKHVMLNMIDMGLSESTTFGMLDPGKFAICGGGFPIKTRSGLVVGTVCVSGLTDDEDHEVLIKGIDRFFKVKK